MEEENQSQGRRTRRKKKKLNKNTIKFLLIAVIIIAIILFAVFELPKIKNAISNNGDNKQNSSQDVGFNKEQGIEIVFVESEKDATIYSRNESKTDFDVIVKKGDVKVINQGNTFSLRDLLLDRYLTIDDIMNYAENNEITHVTYENSGSKIFNMNGYSILKVNVDGNKNLYFGNTSLSINNIVTQ